MEIINISYNEQKDMDIISISDHLNNKHLYNIQIISNDDGSVLFKKTNINNVYCTFERVIHSNYEYLTFFTEILEKKCRNNMVALSNDKLFNAKIHINIIPKISLYILKRLNNKSSIIMEEGVDKQTTSKIKINTYLRDNLNCIIVKEITKTYDEEIILDKDLYALKVWKLKDKVLIEYMTSISEWTEIEIKNMEEYKDFCSKIIENVDYKTGMCSVTHVYLESIRGERNDIHVSVLPQLFHFVLEGLNNILFEDLR